MATVTITYNPKLTVDRVLGVFEGHFAGKYEVFRSSMARGDLIVKKSGWTGVTVELKQEQGTTTFVFMATMPSIVLNMLLGSLLPSLLLRRSWKAMEMEIREVIETAPEFK